MPKIALSLALALFSAPVVAQEAQTAPTAQDNPGWHYTAGKPKPCRFQVRATGKDWGRLLGRNALRREIEANPSVEVRRAPANRHISPRKFRAFVRCLARHFRVGVRKALAESYQECHHHADCVSPGGRYLGGWQMEDEWGSRKERFNAWWSTRRTMRYVARHGWGPWGG